MPTAQRVLHRLGEFDEIAVKAKEGVARPELVAQLQRVLPQGIEAVTSDVAAEQQAGDVKEALGFFNVFLLAFAAVSLFVGSFIIFNTFTIIVAQRLRELALLRALGASRKQVTRSVLAEALIVGFVASAIGVGGGVVVAAVLKSLLAAFGMDLPSHTLVIKPRTIIIPMLVGVVITTLASFGPARKASKVPPVAAIRGAEEIPEGRTLRRRIIAGGVVLGLGMLALAAGLFGGGGLGSGRTRRPRSSTAGWPCCRRWWPGRCPG